MKKLFSTLFLMLLCVGGFSQGIVFESGTLANVMAKAKKENKAVFVDVYTVWCGPCKMMSTDVFPQAEVGDYFNQRFVSYKIDAEKGEGPEFAGKIKVRGFPTMVFLNADGEVIHSILGAKSAKDLINEAKKMEVFSKLGGTKESLKAKFEAGSTDADFLLAYYDICDEAQKDNVFVSYLNAISDEKLFDPKNDYVEKINIFDNKLFTRLIDGVVKHEKQYESMIPTIRQKLGTMLEQSITTGDRKTFDAIILLKAKAAKLANSTIADIKFTKGQDFFTASDDLANLCYAIVNTSDYNGVKLMIETYMNRLMTENDVTKVVPESNNTTIAAKILDWTDYYWRKSDADKKVIANCTKWCKYAFEVSPYNVDNTIKAAELLERMNKKKDAVKMLERAISLQESAFGQEFELIAILKDELTNINN